ncbi:MAG: hypothetical protein HWE30_08605 [Methylocystaceae bacterium]|nr:hypothetical protein [Methylocystaceae bacterium]
MSKFDYDCSKCAAICCIALKFRKIDQFPYDKEQGERCRHLNDKNGCTIHNELEQHSCQSCIKFSCYGAGPHIIKCYSKTDWQNDPELTEELYDKFLFLMAMFKVAHVTEQALINKGLNPKGLLKDFFKMVATRQKIPKVSDHENSNVFTESWNKKMRDWISKNA